MADVTETRQLVNPTLEGSLTSFLKKLDVSISLITGSIKDNRNYKIF